MRNASGEIVPMFVHNAGTPELRNLAADVPKDPAPPKAGTANEADPTLPDLFDLVATDLPAGAQLRFREFVTRPPPAFRPLEEQSIIIQNLRTSIEKITGGKSPDVAFCLGDMTGLGGKQITTDKWVFHNFPVNDKHLAGAEEGSGRHRPPYAYGRRSPHPDTLDLEELCFTFSQVEFYVETFRGTAGFVHGDLFSATHSAYADADGGRGGVESVPSVVAEAVVAETVGTALELGGRFFLVCSRTAWKRLRVAMTNLNAYRALAQELALSPPIRKGQSGRPPKPRPSACVTVHEQELRVAGKPLSVMYVETDGDGTGVFVNIAHLCMAKRSPWHARQAAIAMALMQQTQGELPPAGWMNAVTNRALTGGLSKDEALADRSLQLQVEALEPRFIEPLTRMLAHKFHLVEAISRIGLAEAGRSTVGGSSWRYPGGSSGNRGGWQAARTTSRASARATGRCRRARVSARPPEVPPEGPPQIRPPPPSLHVDLHLLTHK